MLYEGIAITYIVIYVIYIYCYIYEGTKENHLRGNTRGVELKEEFIV